MYLYLYNFVDKYDSFDDDDVHKIVLINFLTFIRKFCKRKKKHIEYVFLFKKLKVD